MLNHRLLLEHSSRFQQRQAQVLRLDNLGRQGLLEHKDPLEHLEHKDRLERLERLEHKALKGNQETMEEMVGILARDDE